MAKQMSKNIKASATTVRCDSVSSRPGPGTYADTGRASAPLLACAKDTGVVCLGLWVCQETASRPPPMEGPASRAHLVCGRLMTS